MNVKRVATSAIETKTVQSVLKMYASDVSAKIV